jgi:BioD-like phosphotransacetylase family protein
MSCRNAERLLQPGTLIVTPGDREDLIMMILSEDYKSPGRGHLAGVVLTDGILPPESIMQLIRERSIPFISTAADISSATNNIGHMTVKTEVGDRDKIGVIQKLIQDHVHVDRIIDLVQRQEADSNRQLNFGM